MGFKLILFAEKTKNEIIKVWEQKFGDYGVICEINPDFSFENENKRVDLKISFSNYPKKDIINKSFLTGFSITVKDYKYHDGEFDDELTEDELAKLTSASQEIEVSWGEGDAFENRAAILSIVILKDLLNGVIYDCQEDLIVKSTEAMVEGLEPFEEYALEEGIEVNEFINW